MKKIMPNFARQVKALRAKKGLTQKQMAEFLGCTEANYQKMEYGTTNVPSLTLIKLADFFNVSLDSLVGRTEGDESMNRINMGIIGTGNIAAKMADTIFEMGNVMHYAVSGRSLEKAERFAVEHNLRRAYGSWQELLEDPLVHLVYVATPNSCHYEHTKQALLHGKHVLCEKPFTSTAAQAKELLTLAEERGLLLTEAVWTRYMPFSATLRGLLDRCVVGKIHTLTANLGYPHSHKERLLRPELGGGALADIGVYPIHFALMMLGNEIEQVDSSAILLDTGVDAQSSITLRFASGVMAQLHCSMLCATDRRGILYGDEGYLVVDNINNPLSAQLFSPTGQLRETYRAPAQISGYEYEVDAAVKAIRAGGTECTQMPHSETLFVMELLDRLRREWGVKYPEDM